MRTIKLALHWQMFIALLVGVLSGWFLGGYFYVWGNFIHGIGNLFLHAINMIVIPLVFLSTLLGISTMSNSKTMGRIAVKTFLYFLVTAVAAAFIGVLITDAFNPSYNIHEAYIEAEQVIANAEKTGSATLMDRLVDIIPSNIFEAFASGNILPIIFFSLLLGIFITKVQTDWQNTINGFFESFHDVIMRMTTFIIRFAPIGVFAIVMALVGGVTKDMEVLKRTFEKAKSAIREQYPEPFYWVCFVMLD